MAKSPIDSIPMSVSNGACPVCGKWIKVENGKFITHKQGPPIPELQIWWLDNGHIEQVNERKAA